MPFNTLGVATAIAPSVVETYLSHYFNRGPLRQKPTAHISYHEGLRLIRAFLDYGSKHAVEDLQAFTAQWVPVPTWVRTVDIEIPPQFLTRSANILKKQLGNSLDVVGGEKWWQWRRSESPLHAEWIEMKKDFNERKRAGIKCDRVILYVHGGAYYFGSVDEHRYQMQRHARKLKARVLTPRYRLAPQFPFPCGLYDCIATYFYLLEHFEPSQILFAGDSAGGGMVLSMLVTLRDQGCALPAGTILLSPWVDLTHSFPSVAGAGEGDYIPPYGFHHKPSMAWPPPVESEDSRADSSKTERKFTQPVEQPFDVVELPATTIDDIASKNLSKDDLLKKAAEEEKKPKIPINQMPGLGQRLEISIDDKLIIIEEQLQLYAKNELLTHPLVSPVQQPSLGGLPPMLIQTGGAELLRDEQIYLAHKAANPRQFPPSEAIMSRYDPQRTVLNQYPPTDVQLQVWEDLCHVPHTLSFTRPAKYMYRSVAQFGAWALARAQHKGIEIMDDDDVSIISNGSENEKDDAEKPSDMKRSEGLGSIGVEEVSANQFKSKSIGAVGKAGDQLPAFKDHMIRQRVDRHGVIYPLPLQSDIACLHLDPSSIGAIKSGPVRKFLAKRNENQLKFASEHKKIAKKRAKEMQKGYDKMESGEYPPPSAIINRRRKGVVPEEKKRGKSWGLAMWTGWGSSHDENTIEREEKVAQDRAEGTTRPSTVGSQPSTVGGSAQRSPIAAQHDQSTARPLTANAADTLTEAQRRRSSVNDPSKATSKGTDKEVADSLPKGSFRRVLEAGQASKDNSTKSPSNLSSSQAPAALRDANRRSNTTAMRPGDGNPGAQSPNALAAAPSMGDMGDTGKEAVHVPGSQHTFLNANSTRPHNGTVAYPFKLGRGANVVGRAHSPNPSTMTLDSQHSDRENFPLNARASATVSPVELPSNVDPVELGHEELETKIVTPLGDPGASSGTITTVEDYQFDTITATTSPARDRPVSVLTDDPTLKYIRSLADDPVSPLVETPFHEEPSSATTATIPYDSINHNKFESRDSRLGNLGPDGMPTSSWSWGRSKAAAAPAEPVARPEGTSEASDEDSRPPFNFKLRNPVYDPRVGGPPPTTTAGGEITPPQSAVPFKMRHTIYDAKVAPPGAMASGSQSDAVPGSNRSSAQISADGQSSRPSTSDRAPPPPPKDTNRSRSGSAAANGVLGSNGENGGLRTNGSGSGHRENERPPLESFVTARQD
jgi:acetyl esterase/lipase